MLQHEINMHRFPIAFGSLATEATIITIIITYGAASGHC